MEGAIVEVVFLDHCQDGSEVVECRVWGKLVSVTPITLTVQTWETQDNDSDYNRSTFNIVKAAVREIRILKARS